MRFLSQWILTILLLVPLAGAAALWFLRRRVVVIRRVALATTLTACAVSLLILVPFRWRQVRVYDQEPHGSVKLPLKAPLAGGAEYYVAIDGLSFPFLVFTTLMFSMMVLASWHDASKAAGYFSILLILEFASLSTYVCFDLLLLLGVLALSSAAVYALIRVGGDGGDEPKISRWLARYLAIGLACTAVAVVGLRLKSGTFDLIRLAEFAARDGSIPRWVFIVMTLGFLVRMGAPPLHSWLTTTLSTGSTSSSLIIATVIPMTGAYALIRVVSPMMPHASAAVWGAFSVLGVAGVLYSALCAMASEDFRDFVGYSIASMMAFALFGITVRTPSALDGTIMLLLGQGFVGAMLLLLSGNITTQSTGERGPYWTTFVAIACVAWLTVPLMFGQLVITLASFEAARSGMALRLGGLALPGPGYGLAVASSFGVLATGAATARVIRKVFLAKSQISQGQVTRLAPVEITILAVLGAVALLIGIAPGVFVFTFTHPAARALLRMP